MAFNFSVNAQNPMIGVLFVKVRIQLQLLVVLIGAWRRAYSVRNRSAHEVWLHSLDFLYFPRQSNEGHRTLAKRIIFYERCSLLMVDELGYLDIGKEGKG